MESCFVSYHPCVGARGRAGQQLGSAPHRSDRASVGCSGPWLSSLARGSVGGAPLFSVLAPANGLDMGIPAGHFNVL